MKILVINPGSTSTKIAIFEDQKLVFEHKFNHTLDTEFIDKFTSADSNVLDQIEYRLTAIDNLITQNNFTSFDAVIGRGGMLPPTPSGTYRINDKMIDDLKNRPLANHASNLGAPIAFELAKKYSKSENAFIADPVTTDEIEPKHKITGIPNIKRYAAWHALNQKAVSRQYATDINQKYENLNLIVAHLGGGFSFGAHKKGRTINVTNALSGEAGFSPERSGSLPAQDLIELCFSNKFSKNELLHLVAGGGGLFAHLNTKNLIDLENNYETLPQPQKDVIDEMVFGICRSICSLIPDFEGEKVDQILITGGAAKWKMIIERIKTYLSSINIGISVYAGEQELEALRDAALRVLSTNQSALDY